MRKERDIDAQEAVGGELTISPQTLESAPLGTLCSKAVKTERRVASGMLGALDKRMERVAKAWVGKEDG
jgi:hypothetical protein